MCGVLIEDYEWSSLVKIGYITVTCGLNPGLYIMDWHVGQHKQGGPGQSVGTQLDRRDKNNVILIRLFILFDII